MCQSIIWPKFCRKLHENERNWTRGCAPLLCICTYLMVILISASVTRSFQILDPYRSTMLFTVPSSFPRSLRVKVGTKFRKMWLQSVFLDYKPTYREIRACLYLPSPCPSNLHCVNGDEPFDEENGFCTQSTHQTACFHWHNVKLSQ